MHPTPLPLGISSWGEVEKRSKEGDKENERKTNIAKTNAVHLLLHASSFFFIILVNHLCFSYILPALLSWISLSQRSAPLSATFPLFCIFILGTNPYLFSFGDYQTQHASMVMLWPIGFSVQSAFIQVDGLRS